MAGLTCEQDIRCCSQGGGTGLNGQKQRVGKVVHLLIPGASAASDCAITFAMNA